MGALDLLLLCTLALNKAFASTQVTYAHAPIVYTTLQRSQNTAGFLMSFSMNFTYVTYHELFISRKYDV